MTSFYCISKEVIENAVLKVAEELNNYKITYKNWEKYTEKELWLELVFCILGSKARYETVRKCVEHLRDRGLLEINYILKNPKVAEEEISEELNKNLYPPFNKGKGRAYPYPRIRSNFIVRTCINIYGMEGGGIKPILKKCQNEYEARDLLTNICVGIGPKQASLFLRNISYGKNLAILDSHVIRYMEILGLKNKNLKMSTRNQYIAYEKKLLSYADSLNKNLAHLDLAIWIVMRALQSGV